MSTLTPQRAIEMYLEHGGVRPAARIAGVPRGTFRHHMAQAYKMGLGASVTPTEPKIEDCSRQPAEQPRPREAAPPVAVAPKPAEPQPASRRDILRLQDENRALKKELDAALRQEMTADEIRETVMGLAAVPVDPPTWTIEPRSGSGQPGMPGTIWSDFHIGEVVKPSRSNGWNRYNLAIAEQRIKRLVERTIDLFYNHVAGPRHTRPEYPGIVIALGGDMISGEIHEELQATNALTNYESVIWTVERMAWALRAMADHFGKVYCPCVPGNHPRDSRKPWAKMYVQKNADWLCYLMLARELREDKRITFDIPDDGDAHFEMSGHRFFLTHGDRIGARGGDGLIGIIGPLMRGSIKVGRQQAVLGADFDTLLVGHFHTPLMVPGKVMCNGSLKGYDEFAALHLRAEPGPGCQIVWLAHHKHGIVWQAKVFVEEREEERMAA